MGRDAYDLTDRRLLSASESAISLQSLPFVIQRFQPQMRS